MIIKENNKNSLKKALEILKSGGVIALATDTVYGLACDAFNDKAVEKLYELKKRNSQNPIAIFVENLESAHKYVEFDEKSAQIAKKFMPGAITLVLSQKKIGKISNLLNKNNSDIGLRIPNHEFCLELLKNFQGVLAVTSANLSSKNVAKNILQIQQYFDNNLDLIIDSGELTDKASTVIKIIDKEVKILREGAISSDKILSFLKEKN